MFSMLAAATLTLCPLAPVPRDNCVVDGDTFWLNGEKMRIAAIDTPEIRGGCDAERRLAMAARRRLHAVLMQPFRIERIGTDSYGRTLVAVWVGSERAGDVLVDEGLARRWSGRRRSWCD